MEFPTHERPESTHRKIDRILRECFNLIIDDEVDRKLLDNGNVTGFDRWSAELQTIERDSNGGGEV